MKEWLEMDRREFLATLASVYGCATSAWGAPRKWFIEYAYSDEAPPRERFINTLCPMCPGGCGLNVRVVHGCAVGLKGNKNHPTNRGGLCSRASAALQDLYNPDRIDRPLKSLGSRGSDQWSEIGWDAAIESVGENLRRLREQEEPHKLCVIMGRDRGLTRLAWRRFAQAFGTPNLIEAFPDDNLGVLPAVLATHGLRQRIGYDVANASYVLSFSSAWLDAHWSTEQAARGFAEFRRGRTGFRPRWVHIEPRHGLTAAKADEWIPIRPGTEGALALGLAHVIVREGLYDRPFIEEHGYGFEDWTDHEGNSQTGFRRMVLQEYAPVRVQQITGVPEGTIFRLAREFSSNRPAVALGFDGGGCGTQATYDRMAIHALNALVGSIDVPGGVTVFQDLPLLEDDTEPDAVAAKGLDQAPLDGPPQRRLLADNAIDLLVTALERSEPYPVEAVILVDADPVFALPEGDRLAKALGRIPFVAAFSAYHSDSARYANVILPVPHSFHRWDFDVGHTLAGHPVVSVAQPVMPPAPDTSDPYAVTRALAERLGGAVSSALPWPDSKTAVDAMLQELYETGKGAAFGPANEESWAQLLESRGWRAPFAASIREFRKDVLAGGGWTDPIYFHREWDRVFHMPPGKFAFSSDFLARSFEAVGLPPEVSDPKRACLPCCATEPRKSDPNYPFELYVYPLPNLVAAASPNLPWLNDVAGAYMFERWQTWVEMHPETAARLGVQDQARVEVRTPRGSLELPLKLYPGLPPEVIAIPFGFGHETGGRWCEGIGENPGRVVTAATDPLTGRALWTATRASVRKA